MDDFQIRPYRPGDEEQILDLFNRVFLADDPGYVPRQMASWRHRYVDNPTGYQVLVATDKQEQIIANYSAMSLNCSVRGRRMPCAQAVDSIVDRAWRGSLRKSSVFVRMGRAYLEEYCDPEREQYNEYAYGLPNNQAFGVGTRILGYKPVHCPMPAQVREFDRGWVAELRREAGAVTVLEDDWSSLAEMEALFLETLDEVPLGLWRDAAYLAWRYRDWPDVDYRVALARRDGKLVAAVFFSMGWMGHPIVPLVDWLGRGDDHEAVAALLAHVCEMTLAAGGRRLETWVTPNMSLAPTLQGLGFEPEDGPFNLCIMVYGGELDLDWARAHWFFTMGDSDIY
jgi:hypothetical protein